ncbi:MAG: F0F1 ATP synthase subunit B [Bacillota bacterium]|nr:F0F1 ATP synthase subunit B [Bacillota bacterium]
MPNGIVSIDWNLVVWSIVNFVVFFGLLTYFGWKPLLRMLEEREKRIAGDLAHAENEREAAAKARHEYEQRLRDAQAKVEEMLNQAQATAAQLREQQLRQTQEEAAAILARAEQAIARERDEALAQLRREVADLAVEVARRVIERDFGEEDQRRLAREFVEEIGATRHGT